jgi:Cu+-exporting ATPase
MFGRPARNVPDAQAKTVVDPVCGMWIDLGTAVATRRLGASTIYLCSSGCAGTFDADPEHYVLHVR